MITENRTIHQLSSLLLTFWQNTKYTYRGVDDVNSHKVKANEEQMDKTLTKRY